MGYSNQPGAGKAMFLGLAKCQKEVKALEIEGQEPKRHKKRNKTEVKGRTQVTRSK